MCVRVCVCVYYEFFSSLDQLLFGSNRYLNLLFTEEQVRRSIFNILADLTNAFV